MTTYAIKITQLREGNVEETLFSKPLTSNDHIEKLKKRLVKNDSKLARYVNFFSETKKALKIQNIVLRVLHTIIAFFSDLITWPSNYKERFKESIPVYQYLKSKGVSDSILSKNLPKNIYLICREEHREDRKISLWGKIYTNNAALSSFSVGDGDDISYSAEKFDERLHPSGYPWWDINITSRFVKV